jgi:hypothetical protein
VEYEHVFQPLPADTVRRTILEIADIARACETQREAKEKTKAYQTFAADYRIVYGKITDPETAKDEKKMELLLGFVDQLKRVEESKQSMREAEQNAANLMFKAALSN